MVKHKDDKLLGALIELMLSPEYKHDYKLIIKPPIPKPTIPTSQTFIKFRSLLYSKSIKLVEYLETLDPATSFSYSHIANQTDLEVPFKFIADTFGLFNRFNRNEYYINFGFPKLPCHIQVIPKERQMINIKIDDIITATYLDGRYYKEISIEILEQVKKLYLEGDLTGYIIDDVYYITNYYPKGDYTFARRIMAVEASIIRARESLELPNLEVVRAYTLTHEKYLKNYLIESHEVICKQDTLPVFGKSNNMIALDCNKFIKLEEIKNGNGGHAPIKIKDI